MKALYQTIRARIETLPSIKHVRLWNNQFDRSNDDDAGKNTEQAFRYPCAFIEFPEDNEQTSAGFGVKTLNVLIKIRIGFESYKLEDLAVFDIAGEVQEVLEGYETTGMAPLTYEGQRMDSDHDNVYVYELNFRTQWSDQTKYIKRDAIEIPENTLSLSITKDLDIDNQIVRTGDGE